MKQFVLTVSAGKRLIGKAMASHPAVSAALANGTLVIVAGSTNAYVAEEVLRSIGQAEGFSHKGFHRGWVLPPGLDRGKVDAPLPGDVIIRGGQWLRGKQIFDVAGELGPSDLILKGANALDLAKRKGAVLVGHPQAGTAGATLLAVFGRRAGLIVPVGLEKLVGEDLDELALAVNDPAADGPRLLPLPGRAFCELDAIELLTGCRARLIAAGGVHGAEGASWLAVEGTAKQVAAASELIDSVANEPPCGV